MVVKFITEALRNIHFMKHRRHNMDFFCQNNVDDNCAKHFPGPEECPFINPCTMSTFVVTSSKNGVTSYY